MKAERAWVLLPSGQRLDLLDPHPEAWTDRDLAISLSRTHRWGGHSRWDLPLSVAQHSLLVLVVRQKMNALRPLTAAEALRELLHDAEEAFLCFDLALEAASRRRVQVVTDRLRSAIAIRYQISQWQGAHLVLHKQADHLAAASEALHVTGWSRSDIRDTLGMTVAPISDDPLPLLDGLQAWQPWPPRIAAALFLGKLRELTSADQASRHHGGLFAVVDRERTICSLAAASRQRAAYRLQPFRHLRLRRGL